MNTIFQLLKFQTTGNCLVSASHAAIMLMTAQSVKYFPAERLFMLLSFVSVWYLSSCSSPEYCDKDGCPEITGKGIVNVVNGLI